MALHFVEMVIDVELRCQTKKRRLHGAKKAA